MTPRRPVCCFGSLVVRLAALVTASCQQAFYFDRDDIVASDASVPSRTVSESHDPLHCANDSDCGLASLHCDSTAGACVECAVDEDCAAQPSKRCDSTQHRCVECRVSRDCLSGYTCDGVANRCMPICNEEPDCPFSAHACDERRGVCVACDDDHECDSSSRAPYCAADGTGCVECRMDSHCAASRWCDPVLSVCIACRDTRDCAPGAVCDPDVHSCTSQ